MLDLDRKHITGTTRNKRVILLTPTQAGKIHDKRQRQEAELVEYIPNKVDDVETSSIVQLSFVHQDLEAS